MDAGRTHEDQVEDWRHGRCYAFALAVSRSLGWPLRALVVDVPNGHRPSGRGPHLVHAWNLDGDGRAVDAGGVFDEADLYGEYLGPTARRWWYDRVVDYADEAAFIAALRDSCGDEHWECFRSRALEPAMVEADAFVTEHLLPSLDVVAAPSP